MEKSRNLILHFPWEPCSKNFPFIIEPVQTFYLAVKRQDKKSAGHLICAIYGSTVA